MLFCCAHFPESEFAQSQAFDTEYTEVEPEDTEHLQMIGPEVRLRDLWFGLRALCDKGLKGLDRLRLCRARFAAANALFFLFVSLLTAHAAAPKLEWLYPAGGKQGSTIKVEAGGSSDSWPPKIWTRSPGVVFKPNKEKGKFDVTIGKDVAPGPYLVRLYNETGASDLRAFVVGQQREFAEKEPNDGADKRQPIKTLPVTVNGRLEKVGDVDSFELKLEAGRTLVAMVDAFSLGSPVDPHLQLLDERGIRVAFGNDSYNLDPVLVYAVENAGTYTLQIAGFAHPPKADVKFTGDNATIYRVTITDGPAIRHAFPAPSGKADALYVSGWNLAPIGEQPKGSFVLSDRNFVSAARVIPRLRASPSGLPEQLEQEPNNTTAEAQAFAVPGVINGCLQAPGDEDRFTFTAKKGSRHEFRVAAATLGSPIVAVLRLDDDDGKQLLREEMSVTLQDPMVAWTAPADGKYVARISDLFRNGSADSLYRLEVRPPTPEFTGKTDNQRYRLDPGKTIDIKVAVARLNGYDDCLTVKALNLPDGVTASPVAVPAGKSGEVKVTLRATKDAEPASQQIRVVVVSEGETTFSKPAVFDFRAKNAKTGDPLVTETESIWLTVPCVNTPPDAPVAPKKT